MVKSLIIVIVSGIILFLMLSKVSITVNPFKISLPNWPLGLGVILIFIGMFLIYFNGIRVGRVQGANAIIYMLKEKVEKTNEDK